MFCILCLFFKQKTAYEMRISDWSSDVCSSDLGINGGYAKTRFRSVVNDTSMEFGNFTVRNIFGYVTSLVRQSINTGATPILQLPTGAGTSIPFVLFQEIGRAHV